MIDYDVMVVAPPIFFHDVSWVSLLDYSRATAADIWHRGRNWQDTGGGNIFHLTLCSLHFSVHVFIDSVQDHATDELHVHVIHHFFLYFSQLFSHYSQFYATLLFSKILWTCGRIPTQAQ